MATYINVPVPEHLVPAVMAFITERMSANETTKPISTPEPPAASAGWSGPELSKVWNDSGDRMRKTLALLSENPGKPVPGDDIAKAIGKEGRGHIIAGMMGAFGRRLKHRHNGKWPFSANWNASTARWEYTMSPEVAEIISKFAKAEVLP